MTVYARNDLAYTSVSDAHGGCGSPHSRPVEHGIPVETWALTCAPCEVFLRTDPNWSTTLSELPETFDEKSAREDAEKRGERNAQKSQAEVNVRLASSMELLTELVQRGALPPAAPAGAVAGLLECANGHPNEPGTKFCGECGISLRVPAKRTCPDGHEVDAKAKFCGECGAGMAPAVPAPAPESVPEPPADAVPSPVTGAPSPVAAGRVRPLKDRRVDDLRDLARKAGLDDSGTKRELLARLGEAA